MQGGLPENFTYTGLPVRVIFGAGVLEHLPREVAQLGLQRLLLLCTPGQRAVADRAAAALGERCVATFDGAVMHVPVESARAAKAAAREHGADGLLAVGGGSTTGLAKAVALETRLPIIAVPTTYAGSEMTPIYGLTESGIKRTGRDTHVLPKTVLYDPLLSLRLPVSTSATSGMNAIAHAVEGLYAQEANPIVALLAEAGIRALAQGLPIVMQHPQDVAARSQCLYGAWLCGIVLGSVGMSLHHKLCHTLGGSFNLPHAETHSIVLPHAAAYNALAAPAAMEQVARALGVEDAPRGLFELAQRLGAPLGLQQIGMRAEDLDRAAELATQAPYFNPRRVERADIRELLNDAFLGRAPSSVRTPANQESG
jgi:maleylacetate reductase